MTANGYLLDTRVVLWAAGSPQRLGTTTTQLLSDPTSTLYVSSVSIAEMAIKAALGKLTLPVSPVELCEHLGLNERTLSWHDAATLASLPALRRDPFDRLLLAQALTGNLTLVSADSSMLQYPDVALLAATE